jgi:hypothetical protein
MSSKYANEEVGSEMGGNFTLAPAGNHKGVCIGVALIGTVDHEFEGKKSRRKTVRLYFELSNTTNPEDEGRPFIVGQDYLNSMNAKANLRKLLAGAWGKITDEQAERFNLVHLLTCQCLINVTVRKSAKGTEYNDILNLSPIPDGDPLPVQKTEEFLFNFNLPFKQAEFDRLEPFVQAKIKTSDEWVALVGSPAPQAQTAAPAGAVPFAQQTPAPSATVPAGQRPF